MYGSETTAWPNDEKRASNVPTLCKKWFISVVQSLWQSLGNYPGHQRFFSRAAGIFGVAEGRHSFGRRPGNRARKVSGTQGRVELDGSIFRRSTGTINSIEDLAIAIWCSSVYLFNYSSQSIKLTQLQTIKVQTTLATTQRTLVLNKKWNW